MTMSPLASKVFQGVAADERRRLRCALPLAFAAEHRYVSQSRIPHPVKFDDATWNRWSEWIDVIREDMSRIRNDAAIFSTFRRVVLESTGTLELSGCSPSPRE